MSYKSFSLLIIIIFGRAFLSGSILAQNLITNSEFDNGDNGWTLTTSGGALATTEVSNGSLLSGQHALVAHCQLGGANAEAMRISQSIMLKTGRLFHVSFMALSSVPRSIRIGFAAGRQILWESDSISLTPAAGRYGPYDFACRSWDGTSMFSFMTGGVNSVDVTLDSVVVTMTNDPDHPRPEDCFTICAHPFQNMVLPYRLMIPTGVNPSLRCPLVLALHGSGERGADNLAQLTANKLAFTWSDSASQAQWPCFVVAPQCPSNRWWVETQPDNDGSYHLAATPISQPMAAVVDLLDSLMLAYPVDTNRIYVTGLSMGGYGTWDLIMRYPHRFAAAVPMSGGGDSTQVANLMYIPIWDFHGDQDETIPVLASRNIIEAFDHHGRTAVYTHSHNGVSNPNPDSVMNAAVAAGAKLLYTEYAGGGHLIWNQSYNLHQLHEWVFAQSLKSVSVNVASERSSVPNTFFLSHNYPNPFNPSTSIRYALPASSQVRLAVYNVLGQQIRTLVDSFQNSGEYSATWNGTDERGNPVSSGIYFCRLSAAAGPLYTKMVLLR